VGAVPLLLLPLPLLLLLLLLLLLPLLPLLPPPPLPSPLQLLLFEVFESVGKEQTKHMSIPLPPPFCTSCTH
jgi:hypothetical protein